nr:unnamed protein product [Haemonchus contortus]
MLNANFTGDAPERVVLDFEKAAIKAAYKELRTTILAEAFLRWLTVLTNSNINTILKVHDPNNAKEFRKRDQERRARIAEETRLFGETYRNRLSERK